MGTGYRRRILHEQVRSEGDTCFLLNFELCKSACQDQCWRDLFRELGLDDWWVHLGMSIEIRHQTALDPRIWSL